MRMTIRKMVIVILIAPPSPLLSFVRDCTEIHNTALTMDPLNIAYRGTIMGYLFPIVLTVYVCVCMCVCV